MISGDFAGWNFGLAQAGWGGMFIATIVVAFMYLCMCLAMSEMSTMLPTAGGGYSFARTAFGSFGGYLTGSAILIEYAIAPAAIACFIGALRSPVWYWRLDHLSGELSGFYGLASERCW